MINAYGKILFVCFITGLREKNGSRPGPVTDWALPPSSDGSGAVHAHSLSVSYLSSIENTYVCVNVCIPQQNLLSDLSKSGTGLKRKRWKLWDRFSFLPATNSFLCVWRYGSSITSSIILPMCLVFGDKSAVNAHSFLSLPFISSRNTVKMQIGKPLSSVKLCGSNWEWAPFRASDGDNPVLTQPVFWRNVKEFFCNIAGLWSNPFLCIWEINTSVML